MKCLFLTQFRERENIFKIKVKDFPGGSVVKHLPAMQEIQNTRVRSLGWEDPLEEEMATHSSILAWRIPQTEEPGGLPYRVVKSRTQLSMQARKLGGRKKTTKL